MAQSHYASVLSLMFLIGKYLHLWARWLISVVAETFASFPGEQESWRGGWRNFPAFVESPLTEEVIASEGNEFFIIQRWDKKMRCRCVEVCQAMIGCGPPQICTMQPVMVGSKAFFIPAPITLRVNNTAWSWVERASAENLSGGSSTHGKASRQQILQGVMISVWI